MAIWKEVGWNTIIYLAALTGIPAEQYEAATVDGANGFQKLIYITLPSIAPVVALMLIFTIAQLVTNSPISFDAIYNLRNALVSSYSDTLDYYIYLQGIMRVKLALPRLWVWFGTRRTHSSDGRKHSKSSHPKSRCILAGCHSLRTYRLSTGNGVNTHNGTSQTWDFWQPASLGGYDVYSWPS